MSAAATNPAVPTTLLILDTETTGLQAPEAELCEIGAVLFSVPHRAVLQQLSFLLGVYENKAEPVNGIDAEITRLAMPHQQARALFFSLVDSADALLAHNASFDRPWIESFLQKALGATPAIPWICSYEGISWPDLKPNPSLASLALAHGIPVWSAHRALTDCTYLAQVLQRAPNLEQLLLEGLEPRHLVAADLPFSRKDEAKEAGFRWEPQAKQWRRRLTNAQIEALPFPFTWINA
ncbi:MULTISPECIES: 3'-5' exonuclease [unclassified Synechococcus]|uniref:3'-5' exonuclease n=1 Tax=unclassified Synechococcus TaxID=2626047 RepID=UPI0009F9AE86|nr:MULTISPECIES: 3'-5' exonuclease [unclassified Synechococcus]TWB89040.1 DNA polymerase-3 subunit epsilon [Synechococcus sp. Ace-Pa]